MMGLRKNQEILGKMGTLLPCLAQQSRKAPILPYPVLQLMEWSTKNSLTNKVEQHKYAVTL